MPQKKKANLGAPKPGMREKGNTKEFQDLMGESEITALGNPYFNRERAVRYQRLYAVVAQKDVERLGLKSGDSSTKVQSLKQWQVKARAVLATRGEVQEQNKNPVNLWTLIIDADEVRPLGAEECACDGCVAGFHVVNGVRVLSVARAVPLPGKKGAQTDAHHVAFVAEYEDPMHASAPDLSDGTEGIKAVLTINDSAAIIYMELAKLICKLASQSIPSALN